MKELIERKKALKNICKYCAEAKCKKNECMVFAGIKDTPTVEPEVRHALWAKAADKQYCTECRAVTKVRNAPFCWHCGAKIDLRTPTEVQLDMADSVMMGDR